jgi:hypothetical protein
MAKPKLEFRVTQNEDGDLTLHYEGNATCELRPDETLIQNLERAISYWREQVDLPVRNFDPWAGQYADRLQELDAVMPRSKTRPNSRT